MAITKEQAASTYLNVEKQLMELLEPRPCGIAWTGSTYIVDTGEDVDILVYISDMWKAHEQLVRIGYVPCVSGEYGSNFTSLRLSEVNVILVDSQQLYANWLAAAELCKVLGIVDKKQRAVIHEVIKFQYDAEAISLLYGE